MSYTYYSFDIEANGNGLGLNSMLSFAFQAYDEFGHVVGDFKRNITPLEGMVENQETMKWWATKPDAWEAATCNQVSPELAMKEAVDWIANTTLPKTRPMMVCFPSAYDNPFWR